MEYLLNFLEEAIKEDTQDFRQIVPSGNHSVDCIDMGAQRASMSLLVKDEGIIAGIDIAAKLCQLHDNAIHFTPLLQDGQAVTKGQIAFEIQGSISSMLLLERILLNIMQRMSGIATKTNRFAQMIAHTPCKILDTRKTTPNFRYFEKAAVLIGGGVNHRFGLYDMIMLKDNHIDFVGSIKKAFDLAQAYNRKIGYDLPIEIETRNLKELQESLECDGVARIMLDNFSVAECQEAVQLVSGRVPLEASGGINENTLVSYAETGVDFVSMGALTYNYSILDLSLKAKITD
ncbi:MAG: carboxylating nicotinate-nucleotide diphosphorylase [Chitinophagales bacterium]|nr:carboxylating nicotinate-nucleotide diphosphorylase [Chitinophagales bacterium]